MKKEIMPKDMEKRVDKLSIYAGMQNDEYGEGCIELTNLWFSRSILNAKFVIALENEITYHLQNIIDNTEIVEELHTPSSYTITKMKWV